MLIMKFQKELLLADANNDKSGVRYYQEIWNKCFEENACGFFWGNFMDPHKMLA